MAPSAVSNSTGSNTVHSRDGRSSGVEVIVVVFVRMGVTIVVAEAAVSTIAQARDNGVEHMGSESEATRR